jgi:hypothetical protein
MEKQPADNKTKGVVGSTGRKMPTAPKDKEKIPIIINTMFFSRISLFPFSYKLESESQTIF